MKAIWLNLRPTLGWLGVVAVLGLPVLTLSGAVDMFLKLGDIKGESQDDKHKGEIDVLAWSWGMTNSGTTHVGGGGGAGRASVRDLSLTKWIDKSTPSIMLHAMKGDHIEDATLTVRKAGTTPVEYIKIELKDILVTGVSTGGNSGEDRLTENITLNFAKFRLSYTTQRPDGSPDAPIVVEWNIAADAPGF